MLFSHPLVLFAMMKDLQTLESLRRKHLRGERLDPSEGLFLYEHAPLSYLASWIAEWRVQFGLDQVYYNRNFHIEPTNLCVNHCKFCSYRKQRGEEGAWEMSMPQMEELVRSYQGKGITEVHVVGGVHPEWDIHYYAGIVQMIRRELPEAHVKAFSAEEIVQMFKNAGMSLEDGFAYLKAQGLGSIPGGGAEIFAGEVRSKVCFEKISAKQWLQVHKTAHLLGIESNATMLYGHVERFEHRIDHLTQLRNLQEETRGFNAFIPLKYRSINNLMGIECQEVSAIEDLRNMAICRIYLDNIANLKAYWPMLGKDMAQLALVFGANDMDGTIDETTKIYSMAGVKEKATMTVESLKKLIRDAGFIPIERDSHYRPLSL